MLPQHFIDDFARVWVGFDRVWDQIAPSFHQLQKATGFPPYNVRKKGENTYVLEMAVAGFGKQDIEIVLEDNLLTIRGKHKQSEDDTFLYRGIANRMFTRSFAISDDIVVKNASMLNGILKVVLERIVPENKKPRRIEIEDEPATVGYSALESDNKKQLLTEDDHEHIANKLHGE